MMAALNLVTSMRGINKEIAKRKDDHGSSPSPARVPQNVSVQMDGCRTPSGDGSVRLEILRKDEKLSESTSSPARTPEGISMDALHLPHDPEIGLGVHMEDSVKDDSKIEEELAKKKDSHGSIPSQGKIPKDTILSIISSSGPPRQQLSTTLEDGVKDTSEEIAKRKDAHESNPSSRETPKCISKKPSNGASQEEPCTALEGGVKDDSEESTKIKDAHGSNPSPQKTPKDISDRPTRNTTIKVLACGAVAFFAFIMATIWGAFTAQHFPKQDYAACKQWHPAYAALDPRRAALDIAFLHGLQLNDGTYSREGTWSNPDGVCWPRDVLPGLLEPYLNAKNMSMRSMGIVYNAQASGHRTGYMGTSGPGHMKTAKALFQSLVNSERPCSLGRKPFVLVGHSYGGLIIKALVVYCNDLVKKSRDSPRPTREGRKGLLAATAFMANFKGYVFYGVPQMGSRLADFARLIPLLRLGKINNDLVPNNEEIFELTREFEAAIKDRNVTQFAFGETMEMGYWPAKLMVVDRVSAKGNLHDTEFMELLGTDHVTICKPHTKEAEAVQKFVEIMRGIIENLDASTERIAAPITAANYYPLGCIVGS